MSEFRSVDQLSGRVATPPPAPCALPHHQHGRRVRFQRWDRARQEWVSIHGTVLAHADRVLTIRTDDGDRVATSCGGVGHA